MTREIHVLESIGDGSHTPHISQKGEVVKTEEEETIGEKPQNSAHLCLPDALLNNGIRELLNTFLFREIHPASKPCVILQNLPLQQALSWTIIYLDLLQ
jgi:hypothetical protein